MAAARKPRGLGDPRSLHERIAAHLRDQILSSDLQPAAKLPSTQQLKDQFGASSQTVQNAMSVLKDEGLATGEPGRGIFVREHRQRIIEPAASLAPAAAGEPYRWIAELQKSGAQASSTILSVAIAPPPAEVARVFQLGPGESAVCRTQLLAVEGEPAELVKTYYPTAIAAGTALAERAKIKGGSPTLLATLGYVPAHSTDLVSARIPTQEQYEVLELPTELPVLRTFRVVTTADGTPIEVTIMAKASHLYELRYDMPIDSHA